MTPADFRLGVPTAIPAPITVRVDRAALPATAAPARTIVSAYQAIFFASIVILLRCELSPPNVRGFYLRVWLDDSTLGRREDWRCEPRCGEDQAIHSTLDRL